MRVEEFYGSGCTIKARMREHVHDMTRPMVLRTIIRQMCQSLKKERPYAAILSDIKKSLNENYDPSWFSFDWQKDVQLKDDLACFKRFLKWLNKAEIVDAVVKTSVNTGNISLISHADLIAKRSDGKLCAMTIFFKKADKSPKGRTTHANSTKDLYALVNKIALEERYPLIQTALIFLTREDDIAGSIGEFTVTGTKKSNAFFDRHEGLYEDGVFMREYALNLIDAIASETPKPDCFLCSDKLCQKSPVSSMQDTPPAKEREEAYKMPTFTKAQQMVVDHRDGPMLVCAGPGSGKTATLVGRVEKLIKSGIPPELILAITFTRDAAHELLRRCMSFCSPDEHPEILTLNALGYKLLRDNEGILGRKVKLLTKLDRFSLIETLLADTPQMAGFSYAVLKGPRGLIATASKRVEEYLSDREGYIKTHPEADKNFIRLAQTYEAAIQAGNFISYDEQITLATKLMEEHPQVLKGLNRRYAYIMVDEYQDVDKAQAGFVYLLARHKNLVTVGDDDQAIYAFRGGSNKYMLTFSQVFPDAKKVILKENFRSTKALVDTAQGFIIKNRQRIDKDVKAVRENGIEPEVTKGRNAENVNRAVDCLLRDGYGYGDIAVLASKNATLEELISNAAHPAVLGKALLKDSPLFRIIHIILTLHYEGISDAALYTLISLMDCPLPKEDLKSALKKGDADWAKFINTCLERVEDGCHAAYLIDIVCDKYKASDTAAGCALSELVERTHLKDTKSLYRHMSGMVDYEDDTRIEPNTENSVLYITAHESKGMEWPCVIMADDYRSDGSEDTNRLFYVALTRAKDRLFVLTEGSTLLKTGNKEGRRVA